MAEPLNNVNTNVNNNANQEEQQQEQPGFFGRFKKLIFFFIAFQFISRIFSGGKGGPMGNSNNPNSLPLQNILSDDMEFDVNFYLHSSPNPIKRRNLLSNPKTNKPILTLHNIKYTSEGNSTYIIENELEYDLDISKINDNSTKNEKLFLYCDLVLKDEDYIEKIKNVFLDYEDGYPLFTSLNIFKYSENLAEEIRQKDMLNDLEAASLQKDSDSTLENLDHTGYSNNSDKNSTRTPKEYVKNLYYKPELILYLQSIEKEVDMLIFEELRIMGATTKMNFSHKKFAPHLYLSDFWTMNSDLKPIEKNKTQDDLTEGQKNQTGKNNSKNFAKLKFKLDFKFITNFYYKYMKGVEFNSEMMENNFSLPASKDMFVELLKNNSMTYLGIMFTVNILHSIFSVLGFASDVTYYKNLKELDGVYTKHLFFHIFQMFVAILYVSIEGSHFLVKIELAVGLAIELWKLKKIFYIEFTRKIPFINLKYKIEFKQRKSKDYETEAVNLMLKYLFVPIAVLYLSYRIYYYRHHLQVSVFKFVIEYVFFLMNLFGFVLLTPQIYLNYKLKSIKHMPLKALTFKFLNTIIDDLYAFAVKTPTLYRIFCFKDDVIFVIFIYQIIKYRNNTRKYEDLEEEEMAKRDEQLGKINSSGETNKEISDKEKIKEEISKQTEEIKNKIENLENSINN